ncbi:two-component system histidine kinase PnpS [Bacillus piscicola]|uniref:two-component system histidine kinase PnpS n=1 Tax=Bacillus piscicola TaxID=1632684 RepID=UPI001F09D83F
MLLSVLFVLASLGIFIGQLLKGFYVDQLADRIGKEAALSALVIENSNENEWQEIAERLGERLDVRVTVIKENGDVVGETSDNPTSIDETEIEESTGEANIRYSTSFGDDHLSYTYPFHYGEEHKGYLRLSMPVSHIDEINKKIWVFLWVSFSLAFLTIALLSYRIANQLTRPVEQVTKAANELAKGNFGVRMEEGYQDEIGQLTKSINTLASSLEQTTSEYHTQRERLEALFDHMGSGLIFINDRGDISLINQYCKSIFDTDTNHWLQRLYYHVIQESSLITLIQQIFLAEKKIRSQVSITTRLAVHHYEVYGAPILGEKEKLRGIVLVLHDITELKKLEQVRKDFVANVSHELKTPVTSLKGFAETLKEGAAANEETREQFLNIIWKESDRLQHLINDLLELSRIEQEHFHLNIEKVSLTRITREVAELLSGKAKEKKLTLSLNTSEEVDMQGDSFRLKQIIINLLHNAIIYTPEGGDIFVNVYKKNHAAVLEVEDTGIGISDRELPRIFERFYRVDKDRSRNSGGTGLGLAIVKHLTEAHSGQINVVSEKGKGTIFMLYFPSNVSNIS